MLPKKNRLERLEVEEIIKSGLFFHTPSFTFYTQKGRNRAAFAVSVSKKVAKTAVLRNRIRRRFYLALAGYIKDKGIIQNGVFMAKKGAERLSVDQIRAELTPLSEKVAQRLG
jgi:ribonuclease P protein component